MISGDVPICECMADGRSERSAFDGFGTVALGVLFSLTFGEALERGLSRIAGVPTIEQAKAAFLAAPGRHLAALFQLLAFLLTLGRFYGGAYRFCADAPTTRGLWPALWNIGNMTLLFVGFYVAALIVPTSGLFLLFVGTFHVIDLMWFGAGGPLMRGHPANELAKDYYILFDLVTIAAVAFVGIWWWVRPFDPMWIQFWTGVILTVMFIIDVLIVCRDLYFNPPAWAAKAALRITAPVE
jgi:hypothetical protein